MAGDGGSVIISVGTRGGSGADADTNGSTVLHSEEDLIKTSPSEALGATS